MSSSEATPPPTPDESCEIDAILKHFGDNIRDVYGMIDGQLTVIHSRAQSLIALSSVVVTVTGFSGRIIADTNDWAQALIILGISFVGVAAGITLSFVMPIKWLTTYLDLPPREWLLTAIRRRRRKNKAMRIALLFMVAGMIFYLTSIAIMLAYPEATELHRIR